MFRRSKTDEPPAPSTQPKEGGKGRPTPTRAEARAAARARARGPQDKKGAAKVARQRRSEGGARARQGLRSGEERFLPTRDKGPVRRFVRDFVDARLSIAELLLPLLLIILISQSFSRSVSNGLWSATILLVALDSALLVFKLRRQLATRFAGQSTKGAVGYGLLRSIQMRWLRLPRPQVKLGTKLPDRY
ncbi:MAG: hypothetical protein QOF53_686 [Nocardioidaceae bacterium]|nr:hypothetical protein [Nocardioidaceae bacterium]